MEDDITSIKKSYNSLQISEVEKEFTINSVALGLGLSYRFGSGLGN